MLTRDFDEGLLQRILDVSYEDDMGDIPSPPDVSNELFDFRDLIKGRFDGMADVEVERRLKVNLIDAIPAFSMVNNLDPRLSTLQHLVASSSSTRAQPTLQGSIMPFHDKQFPQPQAPPSFNPLGHVGHQKLACKVLLLEKRVRYLNLN
ncbi:hypothetical protein BVC80_9075g73 [Macleaya cordata]|uniref:Uncharacterized protein n=1 Tax=Macleaya cordata TaxID=56857 RepID=A0A200PUE6_MACCD|nr:hypothetical protein BVC80_9075g73 [Macleaya cordata]